MRNCIKYILLAVSLLSLASCMMVIEYKPPRWKCEMKFNGASQSSLCEEDTYPVSMEYSVPEFFIMDDDRVVFRFFYKATGLKLQFANNAPFKYGKRYYFNGTEEFFDVQFDWLYGGVAYECTSGWIEFHSSVLSSVAYTIKFEFDLASPQGDKAEVRSGTFTVYDVVKPRNTNEGLSIL
ncbi:MAG: hypothetical protein J5533_01250 [Bacteroidales bacterium]|nr:hypothetical protein [Bacteroidales bacterium]